MILELPYPPSVNTYYRSIGRGRVIISKRGREYRESVIAAIARKTGGLGQMFDQAITVEITLYPPDKRRRDIDNTLKGLLDSLTHARIWADDSLIKRLAIEMYEPVAGGSALVEIHSRLPQPAVGQITPAAKRAQLPPDVLGQ